ncbi:MAG: DUF1653 domain-containing protein [Lachnospiraceae bacterium]|nr:DUF1653 domain-containing protein [Lachnospiraceae bacterium]
MINGRRIYTGQIYRHFKNKLYQIIAVANHSETGEKLVVYQQLYGKYEVYARPLEMFMSEVDRNKYPDVAQKYRFELVEREELVNQPEVVENETLVNQQETVEHEKFVNQQEVMEHEEFVDHDEQNVDYFFEEEQKTERNEETVNPNLLKFLDADTYEDKRNILVRMKSEMTDRLIDDIAASLDVTVEQGDIEERYISLLYCIDMLAKFEVNRFR